MANRTIHVSRLVLFMLAVVILGIPLVSYLWETLNLLLALKAPVGRLLVSIGALVLFLLLLSVLGKRITTMETPAQKGGHDA